MRPPFPSVFDSSSISAFRSCPRKFELEYLNHWRSATPNVHLLAGGAYAAGLDAARNAYYVEGLEAAQSAAMGAAALIKHYGDFECPSDSAKSLERMLGALEFYFDQYPLGEDPAQPITLPSGKRGIELSFAEPIDLDDPQMRHPVSGDPLLYVGRADMVADYQRMVLGEDDKTTSSLGASWAKQWDLRCFSEHHELYTRTGWTPISQLRKGEEILQSDADGNFSFTVPVDYTATTYKGPMFSIEGRRVSQFITPNHRVLLNRRRGGTATVLAENLGKQDRKSMIPLAGRHREERFPEDFQRLIVAVQADAKLQASQGKVNSGRGHREHMPHRAIVFVFSKDRKAARLKALLDSLEIEYNYSERGELKEFYISGFTFAAEVVDMVLDHRKEFKDGHETMFGDAFLDELEHWDGWQNQYYTNSAKNANFVATVAALNDRAASVSIDDAGHCTVVLSHDTQRALFSCNIFQKQYYGSVYCVSVPAGYVVTRMAGAISISGNSQFTGYSWGFQKSGIPIQGWLIRGVSILKTKYDTAQAITYRLPWQIERWHNQLKRDIVRMKFMWETGYFDYDLDHACAEFGGCMFRQVCLMKEPDALLEQQYERRAWDPQRRMEIPMEVVNGELKEKNG